MLAPLRRLLASLALVSGCTASELEAGPESAAAPSIPAPTPARSAPPRPIAADPTTVAPPLPAPTPAPLAPPGPPGAEPTHVAPTVDLATVTSVRFRIVDVLNPGWAGCGVLHIVGALEVEVLDVGDPPPHMIVLVSCPGDLGETRLAVGATLSATLHDREQPWPGVQGLPADLPRRYLKSLERG